MKNPLTAGIEPATFRYVTQHLNHCDIAVPQASLLNEKFRRLQTSLAELVHTRCNNP